MNLLYGYAGTSLYPGNVVPVELLVALSKINSFRVDGAFFDVVLRR